MRGFSRCTRIMHVHGALHRLSCNQCLDTWPGDTQSLPSVRSPLVPWWRGAKGDDEQATCDLSGSYFSLNLDASWSWCLTSQSHFFLGGACSTLLQECVCVCFGFLGAATCHDSLEPGIPLHTMDGRKLFRLSPLCFQVWLVPTFPQMYVLDFVGMFCGCSGWDQGEDVTRQYEEVIIQPGRTCANNILNDVNHKPSKTCWVVGEGGWNIQYIWVN